MIRSKITVVLLVAFAMASFVFLLGKTFASADPLIQPFAYGRCSESNPKWLTTAQDMADLAYTINTSDGHALAKICWGQTSTRDDSEVYLALSQDIDLDDLYGQSDNKMTWIDPGGNRRTDGWQPIGIDVGNAPSLQLDGKGHIIKNLRSAYSSYAGLFGVVSDLQIKDLGLTDLQILGGGNAVGGIIGLVSNSVTISESFVQGDINSDATLAVGGVVGLAQNAVITNSYHIGKVSTSQTGVLDTEDADNSIPAGGIIGGVREITTGVDPSLVIANSYNMGEVISNGLWTAGIAGEIHDNSQIINSLSLGKLVRGFDSYPVSRIYSDPKRQYFDPNNPVTLPSTFLISHNYGLLGMGDGTQETLCGWSRSMSISDDFDYFDGSNPDTGQTDLGTLDNRNGLSVAWQDLADNGTSPSLSDWVSVSENFWTNSANWDTNSNSYAKVFDGSIWQFTQGKLPVLKVFANGQSGDIIDVTPMHPYAFKGDGTDKYPFQINDAHDLALLSCLVSEESHMYRTDYISIIKRDNYNYPTGEEPTKKVYYSLNNDIDLSDWGPYQKGDGSIAEKNYNSLYIKEYDCNEDCVADKTHVSSSNNLEGGWIPIGSGGSDGKRKFSGIFYGNGHKVSNMKINIPSASYGGNSSLFGDIEVYSEIHDLAVVNASIHSYVGAVLAAAVSVDSLISNCYTTGIVVAGMNGGGIALSLSDSTVVNSHNEAKIAGDLVETGGGISAAAANFVKIVNSYNTGDIISDKPNWLGTFGGIIGRASGYNHELQSGLFISNAYNTGNISARSDMSSYSQAGGTAAGIVALVQTDMITATLNNVYNTGNILANYQAAGIVANGHSTTIKNAYNTGDVYGGPIETAGILGNSWGNNAKVSNTLSLGRVVHGEEMEDADHISIARVYALYDYGSGETPAELTNNYALKTQVDDNQEMICGSLIGAKTIEDNDNLFDKVAGDTGTHYNRNGQSITWDDIDTIHKFSDSSLWEDNENPWTLENGWIFEDDGRLPILANIDDVDIEDIYNLGSNTNKETHPFQDGTPGYWLANPPVVSPFEGNGQESNPYQISTDFQLAQLACLVNNDKTHTTFSYPDVHYILSRDIDLTNWGGYSHKPNSTAGDSVIERNWKKLYPRYDIDAEWDEAREEVGASSWNCEWSDDEWDNVCTPTDSTGGWVPIGKAQKATDEFTPDFSGYFDGRGHTISKLSISRGDNSQGLFGKVSVAKITNIGVTKSKINANEDIGSIIGTGEDFELVNAFSVDNEISGGWDSNANIGGLVGSMTSVTASSLISNSFNRSNVGWAGGQNVGGIVGKARVDNEATLIQNSYNTGVIQGYNNLAGIVGLTEGADNATNIINTYNTGNIIAEYTNDDSNAAGIVNNESASDVKVINSLSLSGVVQARHNKRIGNGNNFQFSNNYAFQSMSDTSSAESTICSAKTWLRTILDSGNRFDGQEGDTGTHDNANGKSIAWTAIDTADELRTDSLWKDDENPWTIEDGWILEDGKLPTLAQLNNAIGSNTSANALQNQNADPDPSLFNPAFNSPFSGMGTEDDPYQIDNDFQLAQFACLINDENPQTDIYNSANYELTRDINLTNWQTYQRGSNSKTEKNWMGIYGNEDEAGDITGAIEDNSDQGGWVPIGTDSSRFSGAFNGNGHEVSHVKLRRNIPEIEDLDQGYFYQGLFGFVSGAAITDLGVVEGRIYSDKKTGGIVGFALNSNLTNLHFSGIVSGFAYNGGIVGAAEDTNIFNCYNIGRISSYSIDTGGIAGSFYAESADDISLQNSYNYGAVKGGVANTGGIAGGVLSYNKSVLISNVYNRGDITAGTNIGGIVGSLYNSSLISAYNAGLVYGYGGYAAGGIVGDTQYNSEIKNTISLSRIVYTENNYGNGRLGRIWGTQSNGDPTSSNNYAFDNMTDGTDAGFVCGTWSNSGKNITAAGNGFDGSSDDTGYHDNKNGNSVSWDDINTVSKWTTPTLWDTSTNPWTIDNGWILEDRKLPVLANYVIGGSGDNTSSIPNLEQNSTPPAYLYADLEKIAFSGEGIEDNPYIISNAFELVQFSCLVTNGYSRYTNGVYPKHFKLGADIYLDNWQNYQKGSGSETEQNYISVYGSSDSAADNTGTQDWTDKYGGFPSIGVNAEKLFSFDIFDGGGHVISGLKIVCPNKIINNSNPGYEEGEEESEGESETVICPDNLANNRGLFAKLESNNSITNLGIVNSYIKAHDNVGAFIGYEDDGHISITNSFSTATIEATGINAGGFLGYIQGGDELAILNSYNTGDVRGVTNVGGLVGLGENAGVIITNSYNVGSVYAEKEYNSDNPDEINAVGGIIGYAYSVYMQNTLSLGRYVYGKYGNNIKRLVGYLKDPDYSDLTHNYAYAGMVDQEVSSGIYVACQVAFGDHRGRKITDKGNMFTDYDDSLSSPITDLGEHDNLNGKSITWAELKNIKFWDESENWFHDDSYDITDVPWGTNNAWILEDSQLPGLSQLSKWLADPSEDPVYMPGQTDRTPPYFAGEGMMTQPFNGTGTESSPFEIGTPFQLAQFACLANDENARYNFVYDGVHYKMTDNIDLSDWGTYQKGDGSETEQNWVSLYGSVDESAKATEASDQNADEGGWTPINLYCAPNQHGYVAYGYCDDYIRVRDTQKMSLSFDGNDKVITNLHINRPRGSLQGLFGGVTVRLQLKNVGLEDSSIKALNYVGGLIGSTVYTICEVDEEDGWCQVDEDPDRRTKVYNSHNSADIICYGGFVGGISGDGSSNGYVSRINIYNSYNTGNITNDTINIIESNTYVGGLLASGGNSNIYNSYNAGNISFVRGHTYGPLGGIAGSARSISNSYNSGNIESISHFTGGVVGILSERVENSYNIGEITQHGVNPGAGGIVGRTGYEPEVHNSLALNRFIDSRFIVTYEWDGESYTYYDYGYVGRIINNNYDYYNVEFSASNNYALESMADDKGDYEACGVKAIHTILDGGNRFDRVAKDTGTHDNYNGQSITWSDLDTVDKWTNSTLWENGENPWTLENGWILEDGKLPILAKLDPSESLGSNTSDIPLPGQNADIPDYFVNPITADEHAFDGDGTESSPYQLNDDYDLAKLSCLTNTELTTGIYSKDAVHYELNDDVDLTNWGTYQKGQNSISERNYSNLYGVRSDIVSSITEVSDTSNKEGGWVPFGKLYEFNGHFDGLGHTISNLIINRPQTDNQSLFGRVGNIEVKGVKLLDSSVTGKDNTAGFISSANNAIVTDSLSDANVKSGGATAGGLVAVTNSATISYSANTGNVSALAQYIISGGLVGEFEDNAEVLYSHNSGIIQGHYSGGLVGYKGKNYNISDGSLQVKNSYNTGDVYATNYAGGIFAYGSPDTEAEFYRIEQSFNIGNIAAVSRSAGGIVGESESVPLLIADSYNTGSVISDGAMVGGIVGSIIGTNININRTYSAGSLRAPNGNAGGILGDSSDTSDGSILNSVSLGKTILAYKTAYRIANVPTPRTRASSITLLNNYAIRQTDASISGTSRTIIEGQDEAIANGKDGKAVSLSALGTPEFWYLDYNSTRNVNGPAFGDIMSTDDPFTLDDDNTSTDPTTYKYAVWHLQDGWLPTLNAIGDIPSMPPTSFVLQSYMTDLPDTNTIKFQNGEIRLLYNTYGNCGIMVATSVNGTYSSTNLPSGVTCDYNVDNEVMSLTFDIDLSSPYDTFYIKPETDTVLWPDGDAHGINIYGLPSVPITINVVDDLALTVVNGSAMYSMEDCLVNIFDGKKLVLTSENDPALISKATFNINGTAEVIPDPQDPDNSLVWDIDHSGTHGTLLLRTTSASPSPTISGSGHVTSLTRPQYADDRVTPVRIIDGTLVANNYIHNNFMTFGGQSVVYATSGSPRAVDETFVAYGGSFAPFDEKGRPIAMDDQSSTISLNADMTQSAPAYPVYVRKTTDTSASGDLATGTLTVPATSQNGMTIDYVTSLTDISALTNIKYDGVNPIIPASIQPNNGGELISAVMWLPGSNDPGANYRRIVGTSANASGKHYFADVINAFPAYTNSEKSNKNIVTLDKHYLYDPPTGTEVEDPNGVLPDTCVKLEVTPIVSTSDVSDDVIRFNEFDTDITDDNELYKLFDIRLLDCDKMTDIDELSGDVLVRIPNALKDGVTEYKAWHRHYTDHDIDQPEDVGEIANHNRGDTATDLEFWTSRFSLFGTSYATDAPDPGPGPNPDPDPNPNPGSGGDGPYNPSNPGGDGSSGTSGAQNTDNYAAGDDSAISNTGVDPFNSILILLLILGVAYNLRPAVRIKKR